MGLDLKRTYLLLGSNLGEREQYLANALKAIEANIGIVFAKSAVYETEAWGRTDQPGFLNLAIGVETILTPFELLTGVLEIEKSLGRVRHEKWGSRLIDIDIIFYEHEIINEGEELQIPHPEMQNRKFVLQPLAEIAPNLIHPIIKKSVSEILATLSDSLSVAKR
ncbi:2-amino-4-hydroxy-6-hydroxymethyldihydropteridine diphosphokinase [Pedobacter polaris]|uniref:2-amino-4-hydroxy-6-hydroxymethyldihydropteridine pyrophosphokinase n=1 Tax=Pedobacter polaris TaxID=2571273 RepID=A0A4U1CII7_9SPHI|nr:2-amino-4-hydroxy-6-hydroxymethyldihydropteridine diphosphokinase [Pedobacter polaris]TKC06520.1 2-amino-4-hydroxy-6-hydroxymethyldihydropteridine diphosphokinase [Pedobacter polaris]